MLKIDIKPSRQFIILALILLVSSEAIIVWLPLMLWIKICLLIMIFFYGLSIIIKHGLLLHKHSVVSLQHDEEGWSVFERGTVYESTIREEGRLSALLGCSTLTTRLCVLRFQGVVNASKQTCVVFRDSVTSELYHQILLLARK